MRTRLMFSLVTVAAAGCGSPSRGDWAADTANIHQLYRTAPATVAAADVDAYLALVDDSVVLLGPGQPATRGKAAVRELLNGLFATGTYGAVLHAPRTLVIADSLAYSEYTGVFTARPKAGGDSVVSRNRYVDVLRRQPDGTWRLLVHSFHPDGPAGP